MKTASSSKDAKPSAEQENVPAQSSKSRKRPRKSISIVQTLANKRAKISNRSHKMKALKPADVKPVFMDNETEIIHTQGELTALFLKPEDKDFYTCLACPDTEFKDQKLFEEHLSTDSHKESVIPLMFEGVEVSQQIDPNPLAIVPKPSFKISKRKSKIQKRGALSNGLVTEPPSLIEIQPPSLVIESTPSLPKKKRKSKVELEAARVYLKQIGDDLYKCKLCPGVEAFALKSCGSHNSGKRHMEAIARIESNGSEEVMKKEEDASHLSTTSSNLSEKPPSQSPPKSKRKRKTQKSSNDFVTESTSQLEAQPPSPVPIVNQEVVEPTPPRPKRSRKSRVELEAAHVYFKKIGDDLYECELCPGVAVFYRKGFSNHKNSKRHKEALARLESDGNESRIEEVVKKEEDASNLATSDELNQLNLANQLEEPDKEIPFREESMAISASPSIEEHEQDRSVDEKFEMPENDAVGNAIETINKSVPKLDSSVVKDFKEDFVSSTPQLADSDPNCQKHGNAKNKWKCTLCNREFQAGQYHWDRHVQREMHKENLKQLNQEETQEIMDPLDLSSDKKSVMADNDTVSNDTQSIHESAPDLDVSNVNDFPEDSASSKPQVAPSDADPTCEKHGVINRKWRCNLCKREIKGREYNWSKHVESTLHQQNLVTPNASKDNGSESVHPEIEKEEHEIEEEKEDFLPLKMSSTNVHDNQLLSALVLMPTKRAKRLGKKSREPVLVVETPPKSAKTPTRKRRSKKELEFKEIGDALVPESTSSPLAIEPSSSKSKRRSKNQKAIANFSGLVAESSSHIEAQPTEPTPSLVETQRKRKRKSKLELEKVRAYFKQIGENLYKCELCPDGKPFPRMGFAHHVITKLHKTGLARINEPKGKEVKSEDVEKKETDSSHLPTSSSNLLENSPSKLLQSFKVVSESESPEEIKRQRLSADELTARDRKNQLEQIIKDYKDDDSMDSSDLEEKIDENIAGLSPLSTPSPPNVIHPVAESPTPPKIISQSDTVNDAPDDETHEPNAIMSPTVSSSKNDAELESPTAAEVQIVKKPEVNSEEDINNRLRQFQKMAQARKKYAGKLQKMSKLSKGPKGKNPIVDSSSEEDEEENETSELKWYQRPDYVPNDMRGLQDPKARENLDRIIRFFRDEKLYQLMPDDVAEKMEAVAKMNVERGLPAEQSEMMWQNYSLNPYPDHYSRVPRPDLENGKPDENGLVDGHVVPWRFPPKPTDDQLYLAQYNYVIDCAVGPDNPYRVEGVPDWQEFNPEPDIQQEDGEGVPYYEGNNIGIMNEESADQFGPEEFQRMMQAREHSGENEEVKFNISNRPAEPLPFKDDDLFQLVDNDQLLDDTIRKDLNLTFSPEHSPDASHVHNEQKTSKIKRNHSRASSSVDRTQSKSINQYWWLQRLEGGSYECTVCMKPLSSKTSKARHEACTYHQKALKNMAVLDFDPDLADDDKPEMIDDNENDAEGNPPETIREYVSNLDFKEDIVSNKLQAVHSTSDTDPACQKFGNEKDKWRCSLCNSQLAAGEYSWRRHVNGATHRQNIAPISNENNESKPANQENDEYKVEGGEKEDEEIYEEKNEEEGIEEGGGEYAEEENPDQDVEYYEDQSLKRPRLGDDNVFYSRSSTRMHASSSASSTAYQPAEHYHSGPHPAQMFTQPMMYPSVSTAYNSNNYQYNSAQMMIQQPAAQPYPQPTTIAAPIPTAVAVEQKTIIQTTHTAYHYVSADGSSGYPNYPTQQQQQPSGLSSMMSNNVSNNPQVPSQFYYSQYNLSNGYQQQPPEQQHVSYQ